MKRFYFTVHPGDMTRERLPQGCHVMLVAAAHWDPERNRFKVRRPPSDHVSSMVIDSGGFTAARRWGQYPWAPSQYADFIHAVSRDVPLTWCAIMDYACEPGVNREAHGTNRERIRATIANEAACRQAAPELPWLAVLQGDTLAERAFDLTQRRRAGLLPILRAGVGSTCGRGVRGAVEAILFYRERLPGLMLHAFGLHAAALDNPSVWGAVESWDSYGWTWAPGAKGVDRPAECLRYAGETYSTFVGRLSRRYLARTIEPRLVPPEPQLTLL